MSVTHFRELDVWNASMSLAKAVYSLVAQFPREERYGLSSQLQRAAVSIPSNIAEGNARATTRDYARFVSQACGSAAELQTQLLLAAELELGTRAQIEQSLDLCERVSKMLRRLHQSLIAKLDHGSPVPGPQSRI
ncbi:four helix bundle protein [Lysobacter arvi]|uniref:Four helix bundle protein n=1 Tax=Lysobacter arvi TaxID=3038776 RepID=A0ABU1C9A0_9GAMM|nr:four helix bundle protein [Lysobacter arvi]MDR0181768.1 four helix bundle protein [Lysobacter arvi]